VAFDFFLYVALGAGYLAGRVVRARSPWVPRATLATVAVLVALLGASLDTVPDGTLLAEVPLAIGFVALILTITVAAFLALRRTPTAPRAPGPVVPLLRRASVSLGLLIALLAGFALGHVLPIPSTTAIPYVLYILLALVGFDLILTREGLRGVWVPLTAATVGAIGAAAVVVVVAGVPATAGFSTSLGFGFYSLAGPLVAARLGSALGLLAFLTNFLREQLTMLLAPYLGPRLRGAGLASLGGATAMDTTLYFVTRYGDERAGSLALATGIVLTVAASIVLPALLALPG
jgi:uncharacterized membrane protein YbjE (DUF340 family)